jgi:hypothetical protein
MSRKARPKLPADEATRWRDLCQRAGVERILYDAKSETLLDAIVRDPATARRMLSWLAEQAFPEVRLRAGRPSRPAADHAIATRLVELEAEHPSRRRSELLTMLLQRLRRERSQHLAALNISTPAGIRAAVRRAIQRDARRWEEAQLVERWRERRRRYSLLSNRPEPILVGWPSLCILEPIPPLALRPLRKK